MKILKEPIRLRDCNQDHWWQRRTIVCPYPACGCIFEIEDHDDIRIVNYENVRIMCPGGFHFLNINKYGYVSIIK